MTTDEPHHGGVSSSTPKPQPLRLTYTAGAVLSLSPPASRVDEARAEEGATRQAAVTASFQLASFVCYVGHAASGGDRSPHLQHHHRSLEAAAAHGVTPLPPHHMGRGPSAGSAVEHGRAGGTQQPHVVPPPARLVFSELRTHAGTPSLGVGGGHSTPSESLRGASIHVGAWAA